MDEDWIFKIPLGNKSYALVNEEDILPVLNLCSWWLNDNGYARGTVEKRNIYLHEVVILRMGLVKVNVEEVVDHKNRIKLDCRRENLRIVPRWVNQLNNDRCGVTTNHNKFRARIHINGEEIFLGNFDTFGKAQEIYNNAKEEVLNQYA